MDSRILKDRVNAIRRALKDKPIDCLLLTKPANVTYATGFSGDDSWAVITGRSVYLLTDSRYVEQAESECSDCRIIQRTAPMAQAAGRLLGRLKSVERIALENSTSLAGFEALKKHVTPRLRTVADIVESLRSVKDSSEIRCVALAAGIASRALARTADYFKSGVTENELAGVVDLQIRKLGAVISFETIVAFGANASRPHHRPGSRKLKKNDTVLIDFGVRYKNYCCDVTRCFVIGRPNRFYEKLYKVVEEAQAAAIAIVKPGVKIKQVDAVARDVINRHGLPLYGHGTGHGLGLEVHEEPVISEKSKGTLKAGMVFTVEPGIYIPGKAGVRLEDDIVVTRTGCRMLSRGCPKEPMFRAFRLGAAGH